MLTSYRDLKLIITRNAAALGFLLCLLLLYCLTAPYTVQSGDTGELVTNALRLRVSHPPGYPLWSLLYHFPIAYFPFSSAFHNASIFNSMITIAWLGLLIFRFKGTANIGIIFVLATSILFWRYAVLPDVFSFHLLFLTLVFIVFDDPKLLTKTWVIFLISLSVANHHTIVFFFPLYLYALLQGAIKKKLIYSVIFGLVSISIYCLLFYFHPQEYGSWGTIDTLSDVVNHFLRRDYGTFRLHGGSFSGIETSWLHLLFINLLTNSWSIILGLIFYIVKGWRQLSKQWLKFSILAFSMISFLLTFLFGGILPLDIHGQAVFERFLLQPILCIFFIFLMVLKASQIPVPRWLLISFLVNGGLNLTQNFNLNNYRQNTIIEDYAFNVLRSLPRNSVYHTLDDTQGNATYYVHDVLKFRSDVAHLHPSQGFAWGHNKAHKKYPEIYDFKRLEILNGIDSNKFPLFMNIPPFESSKNMKLIYFGLVFKVEISKDIINPIDFQCDVASTYEWRSRFILEDFSEFELSRYYDLEYGRCYYTQGLNLLKSGKTAEAQTSFEKAIKLSPFSAKYRERLCFSYKQLDHPSLAECEGLMEELIGLSNQQYYLLKY